MRSLGIGPTELARVDTEQKYKLGSVHFDETAKAYKYCLYNEGTGALDLAVGDAVCYVPDTGYAASEVTADASDGGTTPILAGLSMAVVTTDATYFWVQVKGFATAAQAITGSPIDNSPLMMSGSTDKALTVAVTSTTNCRPAGHAIDASAQEIVLDCIM